MFSPGSWPGSPIFQLPDYDLRKVDGQYELHFEGPWTHSTMWEVPALAIVNELRARRVMLGQKRFSLDVLYARAKAKMWDKVERLQAAEPQALRFRRGRRLWPSLAALVRRGAEGRAGLGLHRHLERAAGDGCRSGSHRGYQCPRIADGARGARRSDEELLRAYRVLDEWRQVYGGNLLIALPDAFGSQSFLRHAPDWVADWTGFRPDSAPPIPAGETIMAWWREHGRDPRDKMLVFSDGLDVDAIERVYHHFDGKVRMAFGWGTDLTNDLVGCSPDGSRARSDLAGLQGHQGQRPPGGRSSPTIPRRSRAIRGDGEALPTGVPVRRRAVGPTA